METILGTIGREYWKLGNIRAVLGNEASKIATILLDYCLDIARN